MPYYLGLSVLSTERRRENAVFDEVWRILSRLMNRPLEKSTIVREGQGRPFFPDGEADFNIAHSGSLAAVSCVQGVNLRTGCDIERIRPRARMREITEEYYSTAERNYIFPRCGFDEARFYEIWTLKECLIKLRGLSVFDMPACPSFIDAQGRFAYDTAVISPLSFYLYELSGIAGEAAAAERYMLATAIEGAEQQQPVIYWFSQASFTCKKIAEIKAAPSPAATVRPKM